ncbi:MAG: hypothetical protein QF450_05405 [Rhodospirillales bacterium]|jgi:hypothetical protein|nr:hypothetical protein [Rhodospirillales bacterium]HJO73426.1 hypothetical protein [Rhodospirillales bacterium]
MSGVLLHVSTPASGAIAVALAGACQRARVVWCCFFTNDGVKVLADAAVVTAIEAAGRAVACEKSWEEYMGGAACPVELGSQTVNSALMGEAEKVISI